MDMPTKGLRLLLADDHVLFRDAISLFLRRSDPDLEVITTESLPETIEYLAKDATISLVLLDLRMPGMYGLEGVQRLLTAYPKQRVAILSGTADEDDVRAAMDLGACAYFPKTMKGSSLLRAIHLVAGGDRFVAVDADGHSLMPAYRVDDAPNVADTRKVLETLSEREKQVLGFLSNGASNKEISNALNLQLPTIKLHVRSICRKLNTKNRTQAALLARTQPSFTGVFQNA